MAPRLLPSAQRPSGIRRKLRALVVDDHIDSREAYADYLRQEGWDVEEVADGEEALAIAVAFAPHAILMDVVMPNVDGIEATRRLRRDPRTTDVPVVCITCHADRIAEAWAAGCAEFVTKPCRLPELLDVIARLVLERGAGGHADATSLRRVAGAIEASTTRSFSGSTGFTR